MKILFILLGLAAGQPSITTVSTIVKRTSGSIQAPPQKKDSSSLNGQWFLQAVLPADTATGKIPSINIRLSAGSFSGNTGCNSMNGSFRKTDSSFVFDKNIAVTRRFCTGYDEAAFLRNLQRTNNYKLENGELILLFDATELSRWTRTPRPKPVIKKA
jgi:heat shock protein HslJ